MDESMNNNGLCATHCSYNLCRLLKEKDIKIPCDYWYFNNGGGVEFHRFNDQFYLSNDNDFAENVFPCPKLIDLLSWFITNRSVTISITMGIYEWNDEPSRLRWDYMVVELSDEKLEYPYDPSYGYGSMEEALENGLMFLMENYA